MLQVDASETGLGGAMLQPTVQGKLQPVAFTSSTMRPNEILWAQIEKETLAICAACEKWDLWLSSSYLVTVDHYSDFIELDELDNTLSSTVIKHSKSHFARHGIPEVLLSDNGPQFVSTEFAAFCDLYGITHITSSPYWPRGNGKAESAVKIVKTFMKKCADIQLALLTYRNTPQEGHSLSPAQRSMGRRTRLNIPVSPEVLGPDKVV